MKNKEKKQSKRFSSIWKMKCFFVSMLKGVCANFQYMHLTRRFYLQMEQLKNWIIRKTDGKECVFISNTMEMKNSAQGWH